MKLILAIISNDDSTALIRGLNKESYKVGNNGRVLTCWQYHFIDWL